MTDAYKSADDDVTEKSDQSEATLEQTGPKSYSRREALRAMSKFSAFVGTTGVVILSAEDAAAQQGRPSCFRDCRDSFPPGADRKKCYDLCRLQDQINNTANN